MDVKDKTAVVIGLDSITGLQSARILSARGVQVVGVVASRRHWGARTNACTEVLESPLHGEALVSSLLTVGERIGRTSVLVPCNDASVETVSRHRERLADRFLLALPPHPVVELFPQRGPQVGQVEPVGCRGERDLQPGGQLIG